MRLDDERVSVTSRWTVGIWLVINVILSGLGAATAARFTLDNVAMFHFFVEHPEARANVLTFITFGIGFLSLYMPFHPAMHLAPKKRESLKFKNE